MHQLRTNKICDSSINVIPEPIVNLGSTPTHSFYLSKRPAAIDRLDIRTHYYLEEFTKRTKEGIMAYLYNELNYPIEALETIYS